MTNFLFPKRSRPSPATALRVQQSVQGAPRPFGYGQARISSDLLAYTAFTAAQQSSSGGKGGFGGGSGKSGNASGYVYSASIVCGLGEGPIDSVPQAWSNKSAFTLFDTTQATGWSLFDGGYDQEPWAYLISQSPDVAQNFRGIAYVGAENLNLGNSAELPNLTFEVKYAVADGLTEFLTVPGGLTLTPSYFNWDYGVAEHWTIPFSSPYAITPSLDPTAASGLAYGIAAANSHAFSNSPSFGVVWDDGATNGTVGTPLTKIGSGTPATGQYLVTNPGNGNFLVTFAAADAGQPVVLIDAALSPGVYYTYPTTATVTAGSNLLTNVTSFAGIGVGSKAVSGTGIAPGSFVTGISGGSATGNLTSGSATVGAVFGSFSAGPGSPVSDTAGAIPSSTTISSITVPSVTLSAASQGTASQVALSLTVAPTGTISSSGTSIAVSSASGIVAGAQVTSYGGYLAGNTVVTGISGTTISISPAALTFGAQDSFIFTTQIAADLTQGSTSLANITALAPLIAGVFVSDPFGYLPAGTSIASATAGSITLSHNATANVTGDQLNFSNSIVLSQPATPGGSGINVVFRGSQLTQVLGTPAHGEFTLSVQAGSFGQYGFAAADNGATIEIVDLPDANPADVVQDFLTNPYYGVSQFDGTRIGNLDIYRAYCLAAGLLVSPTISTQGQANQFLQDLMTATNSELVWSAGYLKIVPYGDSNLAANGASYTAPSAPIYSLDDDDFLDNQGTNPKSVSAAGTPDPVTATRTDIADQENDIKLEYLDRANIYNPTIVEAKDDAAIATFGVKNSGSKQMHLFCNQASALAAAQLMLGRQSVLRTFSFTLDRKYILLDPMDIVEITDTNADLVNQWVRITEITENDDRSLSITAEEYLEGTGSAPVYGHQSVLPHIPSYNLAAPNAAAPIVLDIPVQLSASLGLETIVCTDGGGLPNWGGCEVWVSTDNVKFTYADTLVGPSIMGDLTANFPSGSDPDTTDTCSVDLTSSGGSLQGGSSADADDATTLCYVCDASGGTNGELFSYEQATLTAQGKYNLGPGYLRRGIFGTAIASHAAGSLFARLRAGSYASFPYTVSDVGRTIYLKLLSFNQYGGGQQTLDQVTSVSHVIGGPPSQFSVANLTISQGTNQNIVEWTNPAPDPGLDHIEIWRSPNTTFASAVNIGTVAAPGSSFIDTGIHAGTSYWYYVRCVQLGGAEGPFVPPSSGTGDAATASIGVPTFTSGDAIATQTAITLTWVNDTSQAVAATQIWRNTSSSFSGATQIATVAIPGTTFVDANLSPGTTYYYWLRHITSTGTQGQYEPLSSSPGIGATNSITAPGSFTGSPGQNGIILSWTNSTDPGVAATHIYRAIATSGSSPAFSNATLVASVAAPLQTYTDIGVPPAALGSVSYGFYWICNAAATGAEGPFSPSTSGGGERFGTTPAAISGLTVTQTLRGLQLNWANPSDTSLDSVIIYRATTASFSSAAFQALVAAPASSWTDTGLAPNTTYYYWTLTLAYDGNNASSGYYPATTSAGISGTTALAGTTDIDTGGQVVNSASSSVSVAMFDGATLDVDLTNGLGGLSMTTVGGNVGVFVNISRILQLSGSSSASATIVIKRDSTVIWSGTAFQQLDSGYVAWGTVAVSFLDTGASAGSHAWSFTWEPDGTNHCEIGSTAENSTVCTVQEYKR